MNFVLTSSSSMISNSDLADGQSITTLGMSDAYEICSQTSISCGLGITAWPGVPPSVLSVLSNLIAVQLSDRIRSDLHANILPLQLQMSDFGQQSATVFPDET